MINVFTIAIILMLGVKFFADFVAEMINLAALNREVPNEFRDVFDGKEYQKSQEYTVATTKLRLVEATISFAALLIFWFAGGFNWLDSYVRELNFIPVFTGLLYIGILWAATFLFSLPFRAYGTFAIEERFGLNRTSLKTFAADLAKNFLLSVLIGGVVLGAVLWFFEFGGSYAWFGAWVVTSIIMIFLLFIAPRFLMPIFYKFTPLENGELKIAIYALADKLKFPLSGIFVIDGSRRSAKSNAFFAGFGKHKRIALFDTLIAGQTIPELVAVLAHEIGHYKKKHSLLGLVEQIARFGLMFWFFSLIAGNQEFFAAFRMEQISVYAGLVLFLISYGLVEEVLSVIGNVISRHHEREADRYAVDATKRPQDLIDGLKKLAKNNLSNLEPHPFYAFLNYSHPPLSERFRKIREYAGKKFS
mgnify:CR=1 FL=1